MIKKRLLWQLFPLYLGIIVVSMIAILGYYNGSLHELYLDKVSDDLTSRAQLLDHSIKDLFTPLQANKLNERIKKLGAKSATRITVILPDGTVTADSDEDTAIMENHADRPEIITALKGTIGIASRFSKTLDTHMMYVAIPLMKGNIPVAVIRTSLEINAIDQTLDTFSSQMIFGATVIALIVSLISWTMLRKFLQPLEMIRHGVTQFAKGDLSGRIYVHGSEEICSLAHSMNTMAKQLHDRIETVIRQRNELDAVFSSMTDGVIAIDWNEKIIHANSAVAQLLNLDTDAIRGKLIQEAIRNADLQNFVRRILNSARSIEDEFLILKNREELFIKVYGTILHDAQKQPIGALVVMNNITQIKRLDIIRRDFVANVSHELRTPIAAIKGASELLLSGDVDTEKDKKEFLSIIDKQTDRLSLIIDDLLSLSKIQVEEEKEVISLEKMPIKDILLSAVQDCEVQAAEKKILINLTCDDTVSGKVRSRLLEQAVVNLLDNAIKYSNSGSRISIEVASQKNEIVISVIDTGCGISHEHLSRIFERFSRIDQSRSRKLGGTGLGLAIVKHIAHLHGGRITVDSTPGKGSAFHLFVLQA